MNYYLLKIQIIHLLASATVPYIILGAFALTLELHNNKKDQLMMN